MNRKILFILAYLRAGRLVARGLDNILNYGPGKAYNLSDLAIAFPLPAKGANGSMNGSSLVLIRLVLLKNV